MVNDGGARLGQCVTAQPLLRSIEHYLNEQDFYV